MGWYVIQSETDDNARDAAGRKDVHGSCARWGALRCLERVVVVVVRTKMSERVGEERRSIEKKHGRLRKDVSSAGIVPATDSGGIRSHGSWRTSAPTVHERHQRAEHGLFRCH